MSTLVSWSGATAGPLVSGWVPNLMHHSDFPKGYRPDVVAGLLTGETSVDPSLFEGLGLTPYTYVEPEVVISEMAGSELIELMGPVAYGEVKAAAAAGDSLADYFLDIAKELNIESKTINVNHPDYVAAILHFESMGYLSGVEPDDADGYKKGNKMRKGLVK